MSRGFGPTTKKVILLLAGGLGLSVARSSRQYFRVIKDVKNEWQKINNKKLNESIKSLYKNKLIDIKEHLNSKTTITISELGKKRVLTYQIDEMKITKPQRWDGHWRIVVFDIPEKNKRAREALRQKLRELEFYQLQKSIFVLPYECKNEVDFIIEVFQIRPYVRYILAKNLDNELHLKKIFNLT